MASLDLATLDLGYLGQFVGQRFTDRVLAGLAEAGHGALRVSHGYVVQHLVDGPRTITALAARMGVSQQAASKVVAELVGLGYLEVRAGTDKRTRAIALSARGREALAITRRLRARLEARLVARHGRAIARARAVLARVLADLGGAPAVRGRRVREPGQPTNSSG